MPAVDNWERNAVGLDGPADDYIPVTPDDDNDLDVVTRALYIEQAGNVVVDTRAGTTRTIPVPAYYTLVCRVRRVRATGTTADGIFAIV